MKKEWRGESRCRECDRFTVFRNELKVHMGL